MTKSFSINPQDLFGGISAYMLALAIGLPASNWLVSQHIGGFLLQLFYLCLLLCFMHSQLI